MSGPKVVNIEAVRRRRQRDSLSQLRQLHDVVAQWHAALEQAGQLTDALATEAEAMLARLETMRQREQWAPLFAELAARRDFFRAGIASHRQAGIQCVAALRERRRRLELAVNMLRREFLATGDAGPPELDEILLANGEADDAELSRLEALLQAAFSKLPGTAAAEVPASAQQRELAHALREESRPLLVSEWLAGCSGENAAQKAKNDRLSRALAELELQAPAALAAPFLERANAITAEPDASRRTLLTDSLLLEADELCRSLHEREEALSQLGEASGGLEPFHSTEADAWRHRLTAASDNPSASAIRDLAVAAQKWCAAEAAREDAALRREAVLKALSALGYEVREGMATAWAENGRVVVRKPLEPNYGVELASPPAGAAVQARVVAFDGPARSADSAQRDLEVEKTWCGEYQRMRELLETDGFAPTLQHATPIGEVPLKMVKQPEAEQRDLRGADQTRARGQRGTVS